MIHNPNNIRLAGKPLEEATKVMIMVHGRGASAEDIMGLAAHLPVAQYTRIAPDAPGNSWYPYSFLAPVERNQPALDNALELLDKIVQELHEKGVRDQDIYWLGFSQGACLTLEYVTRNAKKYGGVVAFTGGLIGESPDTTLYRGEFAGTPVFIGTSDPDHHVPVSRVEQSIRIIKGMGADVLMKVYPNMGHTISADEINLAVSHVFQPVQTS